MNKRIREFAIQSGILDVADRKYMTDAEKFAELIIRECRNVCVKQSNYYAGQGKMRESSAADACNHLIDIVLGVEK